MSNSTNLGRAARKLLSVLPKGHTLSYATARNLLAAWPSIPDLDDPEVVAAVLAGNPAKKSSVLSADVKLLQDLLGHFPDGVQLTGYARRSRGDWEVRYLVEGVDITMYETRLNGWDLPKITMNNAEYVVAEKAGLSDALWDALDEFRLEFVSLTRDLGVQRLDRAWEELRSARTPTGADANAQVQAPEIETAHQTRHCLTCEGEIEDDPDGSPGVLVHARDADPPFGYEGLSAYDLDEDHPALDPVAMAPTILRIVGLKARVDDGQLLFIDGDTVAPAWEIPTDEIAEWLSERVTDSTYKTIQGTAVVDMAQAYGDHEVRVTVFTDGSLDYTVLPLED